MMKLRTIFIGALAAFFLIVWVNIVFAASTGAIDCTVAPATGTSEAPWSDDAWEDADASSCTDNAAPNDVSLNTWDSGDQTYVLYHSGFGFAVSGTITGVTVDLNTWGSVPTAVIDLCQLLSDTGVRGGTNLCSAAPVTIDSIANTNVETIGSTSELWGNALTDTWVNDADFGIAIGIVSGTNNSNVFIDYVQMTIEYTSGGVASRRRMIMQ